MKERVQSFGRFLSGMVMPNIGAFIAWGLITALFIATGWLPNEKLSTMVSPMLSYVLPILIAYTGGKMVGGARGAVMGAIACVGVICGAPDYPMLMGLRRYPGHAARDRRLLPDRTSYGRRSGIPVGRR